MEKKDRKIFSFVLVYSIVFFVIFNISAFPAASEEKVINIMGFWDITGPISHQLKHGFRGVEDYVRMTNEKGGINGIKINHLWADTAYVPSRAVSAFHRLAAINPKPIAWVCNAAGDSIAMKPLSKSYEIPGVTLASAPEVLWPPGWVFSGTPAYAVEAMAFGDWVIKDWAMKKRTGSPKLAYVGPDNAYGRSPGAAIPYWKSIGIDVHGFEAVPWQPTDTTTTLIRLKNAKVNYVITNWGTPGMAVFLSDAYKLRLLDDITLVSGAHTYPEELPSMIGEIAEGHIVMLPWATAYVDVPKIREIVEWGKNYHGDYDFLHYSNHIGQHLQCAIIAEAVKRVLDKVGYEKLNGAAVYNELLALKDFSTGGLSGPISFDENTRAGNRYLQMGVIKKGKVVPITDWFQGPKWTPGKQ